MREGPDYLADMLVRLKKVAHLSWLDEAVEHCADNFLDLPMGLSVCFRTSMIPTFPPWCCWPAQSLTACNSTSPKLTALETRDGGSTILVYMGGP